MSVVTRRIAAVVFTASVSLCAPVAHAITFDIGDVSGTLNTTITAGAGMRMKDRSVNLIGKANLNPGVCGGIAQSCQGVFKDQYVPSRTLSQSPGIAYLNSDDGDLNYDKGDLTQAVLKVTQDLKLTWGEYGFFAKWLYFYDFVNNNFTEFHPNMITADNRASVGCHGGAAPDCPNWDSSFSDVAYGPGTVVRRKRTDGEVLRQIGTDLQIFDYYFFGSFPLPGFENKDVSFKLGSQNINWGESTVFVLNSVNQVNPLNANNFTRVGFDLSELFTPTGMLFLSTEVYEGVTAEAYYGYEWKPLEIPTPGTFFSFADAGSYNAGRYASISFGGPAEDPDVCPSGHIDTTTGVPSQAYNPVSGCGVPLNNPLAGLTNTSTTIRRLADHNPSSQGQFGIAFKYFADWLNNGTQLSFYFENYHSKLPYVSLYASDEGCAKNAHNGGELLAQCGGATPGSGLPIFAGTTNTANGEGVQKNTTHNAVPIDTVKFQLEYPENIQLFGMSFNTTVGDISLQGEVSYRPNLPVQIDTQDLTFLALQPMLTNCGDPGAGCTGTTGGASSVDNQNYGSSDFSPYPGITAYPDTFDLAVGAADGSSRSFPSFIGQYRGIQQGHEPGNAYIQGWERFGVWQTDLGATYIQGATDNNIGADQIIWLMEWGVQYVPGLPKPNVLQVETPGTYYHASAGADGSMTGNMQQDCAGTIDCNYSGYNADSGQFFGTTCNQSNYQTLTPSGTPSCGDGLRFNPHQQPAKDYANWQNWSTGIAVVNLTRYESVFPGISFAPITIFQWGVKGTSVDVANQFVEGKKQIIFNFETRYKESLSFYVGHVWITGGGVQNVLSDRNELFTYVKYLF